METRKANGKSKLQWRGLRGRRCKTSFFSVQMVRCGVTTLPTKDSIKSERKTHSFQLRPDRFHRLLGFKTRKAEKGANDKDRNKKRWPVTWLLDSVAVLRGDIHSPPACWLSANCGYLTRRRRSNDPMAELYIVTEQCFRYSNVGAHWLFHQTCILG